MSDESDNSVVNILKSLAVNKAAGNAPSFIEATVVTASIVASDEPTLTTLAYEGSSVPPLGLIYFTRFPTLSSPGKRGLVLLTVLIDTPPAPEVIDAKPIDTNSD